MKFFVYIFLLCMSLQTVVCAKYVYPEGSSTTTERKINRRLKNYDTDKNDEFSLEEYKNFRTVRTRDDRRIERRAKKKGTYVSPDEEFKKMDTNEDGKVTKGEMMEYEKNSR